MIQEEAAFDDSVALETEHNNFYTHQFSKQHWKREWQFGQNSCTLYACMLDRSGEVGRETLIKLIKKLVRFGYTQLHFFYEGVCI